MSGTEALRISLFSDAVGAICVRSAGMLISYAMTTLAAVMLGPDEMGTYAAALGLSLLFATLAPLGSDQLMVRNVSGSEAGERTGREIAFAHTFGLLSVTVIGLFVAGFLLLPQQHARIDAWREPLSLGFVLFVPTLLVFLRQWCAIPLIGTRRAIFPEQTVMPALLLGCLAIVKLFGLPLDAKSLTVGHAVAMLLVWCGSLENPVMRRAYQSALHLRPTMTEMQSRLREGYPFVRGSVGMVLLQRCTPLLIGVFCTFDDVAGFSLALQYAALTSIPMGAIGLSIMPSCARHVRANEMQKAGWIIRKAATASFGSALLIALATFAISPWLVAILGESYSSVRDLLPILLLASLADAFTGPTAYLMQTMNLEHRFSQAVWWFVPVQFLIVLAASRSGGVHGVAAGYLMCRVLWNAAMVGIIFRHRGIASVPSMQFVAGIARAPQRVVKTLRSNREISASTGRAA